MGRQVLEVRLKEEIKYLGKVKGLGKYVIAGPIEFLDDEFTVKPSSTVLDLFVAMFSSLGAGME